MIYHAIDIAEYVINQSYKMNFEIGNLVLQKVMYYIQAAFLVEKRTCCFKENILAWDYGPVIKEVYDEYKVFGRERIPEQKGNDRVVFDYNTFEIKYQKRDVTIEDNDKKIIDKVLKAYSKINNPFDLVKKTHEEDPWKIGRKSGNISKDDIITYYTEHKDKLYNIQES